MQYTQPISGCGEFRRSLTKVLPTDRIRRHFILTIAYWSQGRPPHSQIIAFWRRATVHLPAPASVFHIAARDLAHTMLPAIARLITLTTEFARRSAATTVGAFTAIETLTAAPKR